MSNEDIVFKCISGDCKLSIERLNGEKDMPYNVIIEMNQPPFGEWQIYFEENVYASTIYDLYAALSRAIQTQDIIENIAKERPLNIITNETYTLSI